MKKPFRNPSFLGKRERDQESKYLKEGSSFQPLRQGRSSTSQLQQTRERLGRNRGVIDLEIAGNL